MVSESRVKGSWWTGQDIKLLKRLWERRTQGERTADLAAELDLRPEHLSKLWAQFGMDPQSERLRQRRAGLPNYEVHTWRYEEGVTYPECCRRLGMEPTRVNAHKLRQAHKSYCDRTMLPFPDMEHIKQVRKRLKEEDENPIFTELSKPHPRWRPFGITKDS